MGIVTKLVYSSMSSVNWDWMCAWLIGVSCFQSISLKWKGQFHKEHYFVKLPIGWWLGWMYNGLGCLWFANLNWMLFIAPFEWLIEIVIWMHYHDFTLFFWDQFNELLRNVNISTTSDRVKFPVWKVDF